jgi:PEGA domain
MRDTIKCTPGRMVSSFLLCLFAFVSANVLLGASPGAGVSSPGGPPTPQTAPSGKMKLEDGTPVRLRLQRNLSSADAQVDDRVDFDVLEEIRVNNLVVIPKGSVALGTVTEAQSKRRMGKGGKLNVNIDSVRLADGEKAALRGVKDVKGGGHTGSMTAGIVVTSLVVWPAAPFFLFMHGKDITIPKGTEITAYINGDMDLDPAKFGGKAGAPAYPTAGQAPGAISVPPQPNAEPAVPASVASENMATVVIKSTPDGADITVDGKYAGNAPSTMRLTPGDHNIYIEKSGYKPWQRTVTLSPGGIITVDATLERP